MSGWDPDATSLLGLLPQTGRGPRREGIFALWLTVRVAQDLLRDPPPERAHRRRLQALEHRLSSLTLPPPLRFLQYWPSCWRCWACTWLGIIAWHGIALECCLLGGARRHIFAFTDMSG